MSVPVERQIRKRDECLIYVRDLFSSARHSGMLSSELHERFTRMRDTRLKGCSLAIHDYVRGYYQRMIDELYENTLVFGGFVDDKFYSVHSKRDDYYERHGIAPSAYADDGRVTRRGHYWMLPSGPRPFFTGSDGVVQDRSADRNASDSNSAL